MSHATQVPRIFMKEIKEVIAPCRLGVTLVEFGYLLACQGLPELSEEAIFNSDDSNFIDRPLSQHPDITTVWNLHHMGLLRRHRLTEDGKKLIEDFKKITGEL